jgi:hypothetical protein
MKILKIITIALALLGAAAQVSAKCTHDSDRASDGSRCGGRSSDSRPGGK